MASNGEEKIVMEGRKLGKLVLQHLWSEFGAMTLFCDFCLDCFGEDLVR